jgi:hypothetical protein
MPSSLSETARVEAPMAARKEGIMSEAQGREKMMEPPILMGATGDSMPPCAGAGRANEARPQSIGAPGWASLTPRSSRELNPNPSREAVVGVIPSAPGSSDVMDMGNGELGLLVFPGRLFYPPAGGKWQEVQSWHAHRMQSCADFCGRN